MVPSADFDHGSAPSAAISEDAVLLEQIRLLYRSARIPLVNLFNAPIAAAVLWSIYPAWISLGWIALFYVVISARLVLWRRFHRGQCGVLDAERWGRAFTLGATVTGCLWGLLASVVFVTEDPSYYVFVAFIIGGMMAGSALHSSYFPAFCGFAVAASLPVIAAFLVKLSFISVSMGLLSAIYTLVVLLVGRDNSRWVASSIRAKFELAAANEELQRVTSHLKEEAAIRQRAMAALEESNARALSIGENAPDAVVVLDSCGNIAYWNPAAERIFGYSAEEVIGRSVMGRTGLNVLLPANVRDKAAEGYKQFAVTGKGAVVGKILTLNALRKDGSEVPIELLVSAFRDGDSWRSLGIARDISGHARTEAELREASVYARSLVETSPDPMMTISTDCKITDANEAMLSVTGLSREALIGTCYSDYFTETEQALDIFRRVFAEGAVTNQPLTLRHTSGLLADTIVNGVLYRGGNGNVLGVLITARDITERKQMEMALRDREAELREAQHVAELGSWEWLPETGTLKWSDGLYRLFNRDPALPAPTLEKHADILKLESFQRWQAAFALLQSNGTPYELDLEIVRPDGSTGWYAARGLAERDAQGRVIRVHGTVQDITTRKRREEQIQFLLREVNHRVKNMLTVVLAIAQHTAASRPEDFVARFSDRIQALAGSQDLLVKSEWRGVALETLVRSQLAHFSDLIGTRVRLDGPDLMLSAHASQAIGMAVHELSTNASKYGALSGADGQVIITWRIEARGGCSEEDSFVLTWTEGNGPPVKVPTRRGFGYKVLVVAFELEFDASVHLEYAPEGLSWKLVCPASKIVARQ